MHRIAMSVLALAAIGMLPASGTSQEKLSPEEKARRAAAYAETTKPGPEHKQLEALVGTWDKEVRVWPSPGANPMTFKGTSKNQMVLGGRFLRSEGVSGEGSVMIETLNIIGFDRRYKQFTSVGYDTLGTYYVAAAGPYSDQEKAVVMSGEEHDPVLGVTRKYDMIIRFISADKYSQEVVFKDPAHTKADFKAAEIIYTRAR